MNLIAQQNIARFLIKQGEYQLDSMPGVIDILTLPDVETIEQMVLFPINLIRHKERGWILTCSSIKESLHEFFYHGQAAGNDADVHGHSKITNPSEYVYEWRNRRKP